MENNVMPNDEDRAVAKEIHSRFRDHAAAGCPGCIAMIIARYRVRVEGRARAVAVQAILAPVLED